MTLKYYIKDAGINLKVKEVAAHLKMSRITLRDWYLSEKMRPRLDQIIMHLAYYLAHNGTREDFKFYLKNKGNDND